MKFNRLIHLLAAVLLPALWLNALAGTTGKIAGQVVSRDSGDPLVGVNVYLEGTILGASTDADGYYFILNVSPGSYNITAEYVGYARLTRANVLVQVDRTSEVRFDLAEQTVELDKAVVVEAERPVVQRDITTTLQNVTTDEIDQLPVNNYREVLVLQTGVVNTSDGLHVRGGRSGEVAYFLDGHRVEDPLFNEEVLAINNDAIEQMEFLSGTFNAEYGNALSGVVNIVTKENFSRINANVLYKRTDWGIEEASNNLNENFFEGYIEGPLWKGSPLGIMFTGRRSTEDNYYLSGLSRVVEDSSGGIYYESIEGSKGVPFGYNDQTTLFGKLYFRPFASGKVAFSYNFGDRKWQSYDHVLKYIPDSSYVRSRKSHLAGANFTHAVSKNLFYELRLSYYQFDFLRNVGGLYYTDYAAPLFLRFNNSNFYRSTIDAVYEDQTSKTYTAKADMSLQANRYHLLKGGVEFKQHNLDYFYIYNPKKPSDQYVIDYLIKPYEGAVYLQDKVEFESIILNLGLRYDFYDPRASYLANPFDPNSFTETKLKTYLSPRLGIAYPVSNNMVFHLSYGQFFQRPPFEVLYENLNREFGNFEPLFGMPDLNPEKTTSYELGLHTTMGRNASLQTTFFTKKIEDLVGVAWNYRPLPYAYYINEDFATVQGFEISAKWRNRNVFTSANYTYSVAKGSSSSQQERFAGAYDIVGTQSLQFYPLDFDQRHLVNGQFTINFGRGEGPFRFLPAVFQNSYFSLVMQYGSGLPYTFNPQRARYVADRNNSRIPYTMFFDLKFEKSFYAGPTRLAVFADVRNLFDRQNIRSVYSATGKPDQSGSTERLETPEFQADPTNYYAPRTIYLGLRLGI